MKNLNIADLVKPGSAKKTATVPLKPASRKNGAAFASLLKNNTGSGKVSPKLNKGLNLVARFEINNSKLPANGEKVKNRGDAPPAPPGRNGLKKGLSGKSVEKEPINVAASPAMMMTPRGIPKTLEQFIQELSAKSGSGSAAMETAGAEKQKGLFNMVKALEKALVARKGETAPLNFKTSFTINNGKNVQTVRLEKEGNVLRLSAPSSARSLINRMKPDFKQMLARYFKPVDAREAPPLKLKISFNASAKTKTAVPVPPSAVKTGKSSAKGGAPAVPSGGRTAGTATAKPVPAVKVDSAPSIGAKGEKTAVPVPPSVVKAGKPSAKGGAPAVNSGGRAAGTATAKPVPTVKIDSAPSIGAKGEKAAVPVPPSAVKTGKPSAKGGAPAVPSGGRTAGTAMAKPVPAVKVDSAPSVGAKGEKTAVPVPPSVVKTGKPSAKGGAPVVPSGGRTADMATAKPVPAVKIDSAPSIGAKGAKTAVPVPPSAVKAGKPSAKGGTPAVNSGGRTAGTATAKPVPAVKIDSAPSIGAKGAKAAVPVPPSAVKTGKPSAKGGTPAVNSGGQTADTATAKSTPTVKGDEVPVGKKPFAGAQAAKNAGHKPVALTEEQSASTSKAVGKGDLRETKQEINSAMPKSRLAAEKAGNESIATAADKADRAAGNKIKGRAPLQHADAGHRESVINKNDSNAQVLTKGTAAPGVAEEGKQNNILKSSVNRNREDMPKAPPVRPEQSGKEETTASRQGASSRAGGTVPEEQSGIKIPLSKKEGADLAAARSAELRSSEKQASREKPSGGSAFSGRENGSSPFTGKKASATENISKATVTEEAARTDFSRQLFEQSRDIPETPSTTRTRPLIKAQTLADIIVRHQNRVMGNQRMIVDGGRLGELEVRIDEQSKGKTLHIYVENESARQEVQKMAPAILNGLQARDIPVANVLVDYDRHRDGQKKSQQKATEKNITLNKKEKENEEHSTHIKPPRNYGYNTVEFVA